MAITAKSIFNVDNSAQGSDTVQLLAGFGLARSYTSFVGDKRRNKRALAGVAARNQAARAGVDARNKAATDVYDADTAYRGGLIDSQRGGLASTILNLGGAAGDPDRPFASQLVGAQAAGVAPKREAYAPDEVFVPKKKKFKF